MGVAERRALLPPIRRARGFYLYDYDGNRYLDCWQNGGRALLGHSPRGLSTRLKNVLSTGLLAELPSVHGRRLERALLRLLGPDPGPDRRVYWYRDEERARRAVSAGFGADSPVTHAFGRPYDPAVGGVSARGPAAGPGAGRGGPVSGAAHAAAAVSVALWRPFLPPRTAEAAEAASAPVLLPVLPFPGGFAPRVVAVASEGPELPESDPVSPLLLAGLERMVLALGDDPRNDGSLCWPEPQLPQRKGKRRAPAWGELESALWHRRGPYLAWAADEDELGYDSVFRRFLEAGFVLSLCPDEPSIIPGWCAHGEFVRFLAVCRAIENG